MRRYRIWIGIVLGMMLGTPLRAQVGSDSVMTRWGSHYTYAGLGLRSLPVWSLQEVFKYVPGVASQERNSGAYVRGGTPDQVSTWVSGLREDNPLMARSAIQSLALQTGMFALNRADALSGIAEYQMRTGSFTTFHADALFENSKGLDAYGFQRGELTLGGPLVPHKVSFLVSGVWNQMQDAHPSSGTYARFTEAASQTIRANPYIFAWDVNGSLQYLQLPEHLPIGAQWVVDANGFVQQQSGGYLMLDGQGNTYVVGKSGASGVLKGSTQIMNWDALTQAKADQFSDQKAADDPLTQGNLRGNLLWKPASNLDVLIGGSVTDSKQGGLGTGWGFMDDLYLAQRQLDQRGFAQIQLKPSQNLWIQVDLGYSQTALVQYLQPFGADVRATFSYGDIDHVIYAPLRRIGLIRNGTYQQVNGDASFQSYSSFYPIKPLRDHTYRKQDQDVLRGALQANLKRGAWTVQGGLDYETQTHRLFELTNPDYLARYANDGSPEVTLSKIINQYEDVPFSVLQSNIRYYGYDYLGLTKTDQEDLTTYWAQSNNGTSTYNFPIKPWITRQTGGWLMADWRKQGLYVSAGVRGQVFTENGTYLKDPYTLRKVRRAQDLVTHPANVPDDAAVLYGDGACSNAVAGFRDTEGHFYTANGGASTYEDLNNISATPCVTGTGFDPDNLVEGTTNGHILPRLGVSYQHPNGLFVWGTHQQTAQMLWQQPATIGDYANRYSTLKQIHAPIQGVELAQSVLWSLGVAYQVMPAVKVQISGYLRNIKGLPSAVYVPFYLGQTQDIMYENRDQAQAKGVEAAVEYEKHSLHARLQVTWAAVEGSSSMALLTHHYNYWPYDQREQLQEMGFLPYDQSVNGLLHVIWEPEANHLDGVLRRIAQGFWLQTVTMMQSGFRYSQTTAVNSPTVAILYNKETPQTWRTDMQIGKNIRKGSGQYRLFLEVQNLFNRANVLSVFPYSGKADNDGLLDSPYGKAVYPVGSASRDQYNLFINHDRNHYGMPRMVRLGCSFGW